MELAINEKIFYPIHGAGWVISKKTIEFAGEDKEYLEFKFVDSNLTVSTPIQNIPDLHIRKVNKVSNIKKALQQLKKKKSLKPPTDSYNEFIKLIDEIMTTNDMNQFVKVIQYCQHIKKQRAIDGRLIPSGVIANTKKAFTFLIGELAVSKDISWADAVKETEKLIGEDVEHFTNF
jgi:RNA polymerase-interacting CarD/CdnL/TRCF family regulator